MSAMLHMLACYYLLGQALFALGICVVDGEVMSKYRERNYSPMLWTLLVLVMMPLWLPIMLGLGIVAGKRA